MEPGSTFRIALSLALAVAATLATDRLSARRGLQAPGLVVERDLARITRRVVVLGGLCVVFWIAITQSIALVGLAEEPDFSQITTPQLFFTHIVLLFGLLIWYVGGFAGEMQRPGASLPRQLGLIAEAPARELLVGLIAGVVGWLGVILVTALLAVVTVALGGEALVPTEAPGMVIFLSGLPVWLRLTISLSAGVVEEAFFRGFLQPRVGIVLSTVLFSMAHLSYDQPWMLIATTLLSLLFAGLVVWRRTIWSAVVAHAVFDAIQLIVVIPLVLKEVA